MQAVAVRTRAEINRIFFHKHSSQRLKRPEILTEDINFRCEEDGRLANKILAMPQTHLD